MQAFFPETIWDGDSGSRNSDDGSASAPDWRDWTQMLFEMISVQDYILNQNIDLGTRIIYFGPTPEASLQYGTSVVELNLAESGTNDFRIGNGTDYTQIDSTGVMSLAGTAKRKLTIRLDMDSVEQLAHAKPTQVEVGLFKGYSLPIYAADNEELFYQLRVPYRWDGVSNPQVCMLIALADVEDVNDTFKMQCEWEAVQEDGVLSASTHTVSVEKTIVTAHNAQYSVYSVHFTIDYDVHGSGNEMVPNDTLGIRIRRISSSGTEIDNEIIAFNAIIEFDTDKILGTWVRP